MASAAVGTSARPKLSRRYAKYAKMANRRNRAYADKSVDRTIRTIAGDFLDFECVLNNADLNTLTTDSLQSTLKKLKTQTAKLSSGRPLPEVAKTFDGIQITSFTDRQSLENFAKFSVMENLELLLARRAAGEDAPMTAAVLSTLNHEYANEDSHPNEQSTESYINNDNSSSDYQPTTSTGIRRKRKRWTQAQAAVPFREQFTYSMDFLDDEHFGERYVDEDEYYDDEAYLSQPSSGIRGSKQPRRAPSATTTSTEVNGTVNNNDNNKRLLQLQQQNNSNSGSLERSSAASASTSTNLAVISSQHPSTSRAADLVEQKSAEAAPMTSVESMEDRMRFEGLVPSIFLSSKGRPDYELNLKNYLRFQEKLYKIVQDNRRKNGEAIERTRLHSIVGKPDRSVLSVLRKVLLPFEPINVARTQKPTDSHQLQLMKQQQQLRRQQQPQSQPSIQQGRLQIQPNQLRSNQLRQNFQGQQQQWRQAMIRSPNGQPMVNGSLQVVMANGGTSAVHQIQQHQQFQRFASPGAVRQGRSMAQHYNALANNRQMLIRAPGGTLQTATPVVTAATSTAAPRVFNSGTMRVQLATQQGQQTYVRSQTSNIPVTQSSQIAYIQNSRGELVPVRTVKTPTQIRSAGAGAGTAAGGSVLLNSSGRQMQPQQQQQRTQVPLKTYTIGPDGTLIESPAAATPLTASASPSIYVINPNGGTGSVTLKPTTTNLVNIAPKPMGANTGTLTPKLVTNFVTIAPKPTTLASTPSTGGGSVSVTASTVTPGSKITIQMVRTPGGATTLAGQNIQNVRYVLPATAASAGSAGGVLSQSTATGGATAIVPGQKTLVAVRHTLPSSVVANTNVAATSATPVTPSATPAGSGVFNSKTVVAVPLTIAMAIAANSSSPQHQALMTSINALQKQQHNTEKMKQMLAEQQQKNPTSRLVLKSTTPVIDVGRTVSVQTVGTASAATTAATTTSSTTAHIR